MQTRHCQEHTLSRPLPQSSQRHHHSHSMSLGAVNPNHRVTRRKSVTTAAVTSAAAAAVAAATVKDPSSGDSAGVPMPASVNRRPSGRRPLMESSSVGVPSAFTAATSSPSFFSRSMNSPGYQDPSVAGKLSVPNQSPLAPNAGSTATNTPPNPSTLSASSSSKNRSRRVSEGAPPAREGKRSLVELRCERCGKGYKHGSCLSKHMCVSPSHNQPTLSCRLSEHCAMLALLGRPRGPALTPFKIPSPLPLLSPLPLFFSCPTLLDLRLTLVETY